MATAIKDVDSYLSTLAPHFREALKNLRKIIKEVAPDAEEVISYQMPAYKFHGMLVGFAAFKNHCGFYLWNSETVNHFKDDLKDFDISKGTIRFTPEKPIPDKLLRELIKVRIQENLNKSTK
jgi:uncharacterized protein YdhG (YjbR/CyaY superfamily)